MLGVLLSVSLRLWTSFITGRLTSQNTEVIVYDCFHFPRHRCHAGFFLHLPQCLPPNSEHASLTFYPGPPFRCDPGPATHSWGPTAAPYVLNNPPFLCLMLQRKGNGQWTPTQLYGVFTKQTHVDELKYPYFDLNPTFIECILQYQTLYYVLGMKQERL